MVTLALLYLGIAAFHRGKEHGIYFGFAFMTSMIDGWMLMLIIGAWQGNL